LASTETNITGGTHEKSSEARQIHEAGTAKVEGQESAESQDKIRERQIHGPIIKIKNTVYSEGWVEAQTGGKESNRGGSSRGRHGCAGNHPCRAEA